LAGGSGKGGWAYPEDWVLLALGDGDVADVVKVQEGAAEWWILERSRSSGGHVGDEAGQVTTGVMKQIS
jgi:hypothetical protein